MKFFVVVCNLFQGHVTWKFSVELMDDLRRGSSFAIRALLVWHSEKSLKEMEGKQSVWGHGRRCYWDFCRKQSKAVEQWISLSFSPDQVWWSENGEVKEKASLSRLMLHLKEDKFFCDLSLWLPTPRSGMGQEKKVTEKLLLMDRGKMREGREVKGSNLKADIWVVFF